MRSENIQKGVYLGVCIAKGMVFPVVIYGCESWIIKKSERWRIDAFELWCWRRLFRVPWTARRSNQSILKEINPEYSLGGWMLKLQYFGHLIWTADSLEKTLMLEKIEGKRRSRQQRKRWLDGITDSMSLSKLRETGQGSWACCSPWGLKELDMTEQLNRWFTNPLHISWLFAKTLKTFGERAQGSKLQGKRMN